MVNDLIQVTKGFIDYEHRQLVRWSDDRSVHIVARMEAEYETSGDGFETVTRT